MRSCPRVLARILRRALPALLVAIGATGAIAPTVARSEEPAGAEALLASGDPVKRIEGLDALEKRGKSDAAEKLALKALADPDWGVAIRAAKALATLGGPASVEPLAKVAMEGEIAWLRRAAIDAAKTVGADAAMGKALYALTTAKDGAVKVRALEAAAKWANPSHLKRLRPLTKEKDALVEAAAVAALGSLAADPTVREDVLEVLAKALAARNDKGRFLAYAAALDVLGALDLPLARELLATEVAVMDGDDDYTGSRVARLLSAAPPPEREAALAAAWPKAKDPLALRRIARLAGRIRAPNARALLEPLLAHKDERVRSEAAAALGALGTADAVPALALALEDKSVFVRLEAWRSLGRVEEPAAYLGRVERLRADAVEDVRVEYVAALFDRGAPEAIPVLASLFEDPSWRVASAALAAAGALGIDDDLPRFTAFLDHRDWRVRAAAFEALGRLRAVGAFPRLIAGLADKDPVVRGVCHANLQILASHRLSADAKAWTRWFEQNGRGLVLVKRSRKKAAPVEGEKGAEGRYAHEGYQRKKGVEVLQKARILVVTGAWDHVERVLDHLRIPATTLRAQELKKAGLNPNQVVLVNCEGNVDGDSAERLAWFVNVGGYLMSTDWAVTKTIRDCFPGRVAQFPGSSTGNDVVVVEETWPGHGYTRGVFEDAPALQWWLEVQAFPLVVTWPERVEVIVDSRAMKQRYGASPLAVSFRYGLGKVVHSVSHFYLQEEAFAKVTKPRDRMVFSADNLGLSIDDIRRLAADGKFDGGIDEATMKEIAPDYSMFRMIVNFVGEKSRWVEGL